MVRSLESHGAISGVHNEDNQEMPTHLLKLLNFTYTRHVTTVVGLTGGL